ncbi:uncharacterized protein LOC108022408 [Drosophila biarmipes]|uniref:uncharacterized protein LOC108022408 n=1 Tax=Drosophila biarmipes TaxID=125945 RepID=UPI0007E6A366|nr:uncharacterized protein LOC108022408 [Drosophila biarmipes]
MCRVNEVSPELCTGFYAWWCMAWGLFVGAGYTLLLISEQLKVIPKVPMYYRILFIAFAVLGFSYLLAGALMYIGMQYDQPIVFKVGKILSSAFAMASLPLLFFTIVHYSTVRCLCQYMKRRWNKG